MWIFSFPRTFIEEASFSPPYILDSSSKISQFSWVDLCLGLPFCYIAVQVVFGLIPRCSLFLWFCSTVCKFAVRYCDISSIRLFAQNCFGLLCYHMWNLGLIFLPLWIMLFKFSWESLCHVDWFWEYNYVHNISSDPW
jgi:hypothetical protein